MAIDTQQLAVNGGSPVRDKPLPPMFPGGMLIGDEEIQAVTDVLKSHNLFRYYGPTPDRESTVVQFERAFAEHMGATQVLACSSGTGAIHIALMAAGIGPGDEVILPGYTFIASATAIVMAGAVPVIAEVDDSLNLDPADFEAKITPHTAAVMPVHMRGAPCDMDKIMEIARRHDLKVIEDVAQAGGSSYKGKRCGTFGDLGAFSLQFHKMITTGEGGMVLSDDQRLINRAATAHDSAGGWRSRAEGPTEVFPGTNYRMSEISGALGLVQLKRMEGMISTMRGHKSRIKEAVGPLLADKGIGFRRLNDPEGDVAVALIMMCPDSDSASKFAEALSAENVSAGAMFNKGVPDWHIYTHWDSILEKRSATPGRTVWSPNVYKGNVEYSKDMCPMTLGYLGRTVQIDISPLLADQDADQIIEAITKVADGLF